MRKYIILLMFAFVLTFAEGQNKALVINGQVIKTGLPSIFKRIDGSIVWGAYETLSDSIHFADGWRDIITPSYNAFTQRLGAKYYDAQNDVVTYEIIERALPTLDEAKVFKIKELREAVKPLYADLLWLKDYYEMSGEQLPAAIKTKVQTIRTKYDQLKATINAQTSVLDVMQLQIPYDQIEALRAQFDELY